MSALVTNGLTVRYGSVVAVTDLDLRVEPGTIVGLIGPNGAGKTTSIDAITGFIPSEGRITFGGDDITSLSAHRRARRGLGRTWQSLELFDDLTVRENLAIAAEHESVITTFARTIRRQSPTGRVAVDDALRLLDLAGLADHYPTEISQGQRKLVSAARALAAHPTIVCMDEPAAGLDSTESHELGERLTTMANDGLGILLVDHDMGLVLDVCHQIVVIDFGATIARGTPAEIRNDPKVLEAYLGAAIRAGDSGHETDDGDGNQDQGATHE